MALSMQDEVYQALKGIFGTLNRGGAVRTGYIEFTSADPPTAFGTSAGSNKPLTGGRTFVEKVLVMNGQRDQSGNPTAGNFLVVGDEGDQLFEIPSGGAVEIEWVDLSKVYVGYIGTQLAVGTFVVCRYLAHGRIMRDG